MAVWKSLVSKETQFALFVAAQCVLWALLIRSWMQVRLLSKSAEGRGGLRWPDWGSLTCGSVALLLTSVMTIYSNEAQKRPYDRWESLYLCFTSLLRFLGIVLGLLAVVSAIAGKRKPRVIGFLTSVFTLLIALSDAISM
jgi:heme/copper-type cytochrome/quinol oxidase subunit 3